MAKDKKSFFERITGTVRMDDEEIEISEEKEISRGLVGFDDESEDEGELAVDVYSLADMIVIKSMIAGVKPDDLDISITRDIVTIKGKREEEKTAHDDDYFTRELYWGSFSRTITLPEEIDVDESEAIEKHGLLILKLPKLDKKRQSKLKVKMI
jgi:HSP20 family molecular chaperone IbpA